MEIRAHALRDVFVLHQPKGEPGHRFKELTLWMATAKALVARTAVTMRRGLEEVADEQHAAGFQELLHDRQRVAGLDVLEAFAEQNDVIPSARFGDWKFLELALEDLRLISRALADPLPDECAQVGGGNDTVGEVSAIEHLRNEMPGAATHIQHADLSCCCGQLRQ